MIGTAAGAGTGLVSLVRSVPSPVGSSADFLAGLSGALRWGAAHAGRIITSAAIAAIIGEHAPARDRASRRVYAFTRPGDKASQDFARALGAVWAGGSDERPPEALDAAITFAPVGALVPVALAAVKKGGRVVCGGIHMSDIPSFLRLEDGSLLAQLSLLAASGNDFGGVKA